MVAHFSEIRARATYANVTATLALFAALGGGSFAIASLSGSEKKVVKKISRKQADKRITARAPGLSVEHAGSADSATSAEQLGGVGANGFIRYEAPIPSGVTIRGVWAAVEFNDNGTSTPARVSVSFPAPAPVGLTDANVNFADTGFAQASDEDSSCTGTPANPTAPAGKVCIYPEELFGTANSADGRAVAGSPFGFYIHAESTNVALESQARGTWAYTAP